VVDGSGDRVDARVTCDEAYALLAIPAINNQKSNLNHFYKNTNAKKRRIGPSTDGAYGAIG
jgi:hypothetical protein